MNTSWRPIGVTVLVVLLWIQAIFGIFAGIFFILEQNDAAIIEHTGRSSGFLAAVGWGAVIVGVITALVAWALGAGSNLVRWVAGFVTLLNLLGGVYSLFAIDGVTRGQAVVSILSRSPCSTSSSVRGSQEFFTGRSARA